MLATAAGTFLEIIELDGEDHEVIRCHPMTTTPNNLPPLFPPPEPGRAAVITSRLKHSCLG